MKIKTYKLLEHIIETGIETGWRRAHKHNSTPGEGYIKDEILNGILSEIHDYFSFEDEFDG